MAQATGKTYGADPENSPLDAVRLLVGDTDCATAFLRDSEINFFIAEEGGADFAAPRAAEAIAALLCRKVDVSTGKVRKSLSQQADAYKELARRLRARAQECVTIYAGGISKSEKLSDSLDEDLVQPTFRKGMDDNPRKVTTRDESIGLVTPTP